MVEEQHAIDRWHRRGGQVHDHHYGQHHQPQRKQPEGAADVKAASVRVALQRPHQHQAGMHEEQADAGQADPAVVSRDLFVHGEVPGGHQQNRKGTQDIQVSEVPVGGHGQV